MRLYRIRLRQMGPFLTPWHSDTLMGSLCWALKRLEGEAALADFLERCRRGQPPFVLSDGCPGDLLPAPITLQRLFPSDVCLRFRKRLKRLAWLPLDLFELARRFEPFDLDRVPTEPPFVPITQLHAAIDRRTNTTSGAGSLFAERALFVRSGHLSIYAVCEDPWLARLEALFREMAAVGFGKRKSAGKGAFAFLGFKPFDDLAHIENADGFLSLSHFVPAPDDPTDGEYRLSVKHGKLGEEFARDENPFKKPLLMLEPGACFRTHRPPAPFYGRVVHGLSARAEVLHLAFALALPIRYGTT